MSRKINDWVTILAVAVLASVATHQHALAQAVNVEAAKKDGKVIVYGAQVPQAMKPLHAAFEKKYGISVEYWRGSSTQVSERALTEWRAGKPGFDVVEGNRGVQLIMRDEGLFQKYVPPSSAKFPAKFKEKDGMITPWRVLPISILYNTDMVKPGDLPKTFDDLLNPKWTGKITMPGALAEILNSISISTTRGVMYAAFRGTFLQHAILPIVDPRQLVQE